MTTVHSAIGIVRVSQVGDRDGDSFASPEVQEERIRQLPDLNVLDVYPELDVSGGKPLAKRGTDDKPGIKQAVERIERGEASVLVAAYFDRLFRSLKVQQEVIERVEAAGGRVLAVDVGVISNKTAAQWLSGSMLGIVSEYYRRSAGERVTAACARAIHRGVPVIPAIPVGYVRRDDGRLEPHPTDRDIPQALFEARLAGRSWRDLRTILEDRGYRYTMPGVRKLLANRIYVGEIHYAQWKTKDAHAPLVSLDTFDRVQRLRTPPGPKQKSDMLLTRLGVLRCTCGAPMAVYHTRGEGATGYRCTAKRAGHSSVKASLLDPIVTEVAWRLHGDRESRYAADGAARATIDREAHARATLDAAISGFAAAGLHDDPKAVAELASLRESWEQARDAADVARESHGAAVYRAGVTRANASKQELRNIIQSALARVDVAPGDRSLGRWQPVETRLLFYPRGRDPFSVKPVGDRI